MGWADRVNLGLASVTVLLNKVLQGPEKTVEVAGLMLDEYKNREKGSVRVNAVTGGVRSIGVWLSIWVDLKSVGFHCPLLAKECGELLLKSWLLLFPSIADYQTSVFEKPRYGYISTHRFCGQPKAAWRRVLCRET